MLLLAISLSLSLIVKVDIGIVRVVTAADGLFRRVRRLLLLLVIGGRQQVTIVLDRAGLRDPPLEHLRAKVVAVAQIGEAHNVVLGFAVLDERYAGDHLDAQPLRQKGTLFRVHLAELGLEVAPGQDLQVHVHDPAAGRRVAVEVAHDVGGLLAHLEELLLVRELLVLAVTLAKPTTV